MDNHCTKWAQFQKERRMGDDAEILNWLDERYSKLSPLSFLDAFKIPYPKNRALRFGSIRKAIKYAMEQKLPMLGPATYKLSDEN